MQVLDAIELAKSPPAPPARKPSGGQAQGKPKPGAKRARLALSRVRMSPKRFAVAHKRKKQGTRLDGATITFG